MPKVNKQSLPLGQKGIAPLILIGIVLLALILGVWLVQTKTNIFPHADESAIGPQTAFILAKKSPNIPVVYEDPQVGSGGGVIMKSKDPIKPGDDFAVDVLVSSDIDTANTFSAIIGFPNDLLDVVAISKQQRDMPGLPTPVKSSKLDSILVQLIQEREKNPKGKITSGDGYYIDGGKVMVSIRISAKFNSKTANLEQYGFDQTGYYDNYSLVEGYVPIEALNKISAIEGVEYISAVLKPSLNTKSQVNQSVSNTSTENTAQVTGTQLIGPGCKVGGCSGQICQDAAADIGFTTCEFKDQYACYQNARCEKQADDQCDWTKTDTLQYCLEHPLVVEKPIASCRPIPSCVYGNPACDIYVDPNDPSWCHADPQPNPINDYFIQFWLPDTGFNNENGKIFLSGGTLKGLKTTLGQQPIMATIIFRAKKAGQASLEFADDSLILRSGDSNNILTSKQGLMIDIGDQKTVKGDLNGDGAVDSRDFSILVSNWGSNNPQADLNGDGIVNLYDLSFMITNWTGPKN